MKLHNNTTDGEAARKAVITFGTLLEIQLPYFIPETEFIRDKNAGDSHITAICKYLSKSRTATYENGIITLANRETDQHMIDSVWAMIDVLTGPDTTIPVSKAISNSFALQSPESLCFIKNNQKMIRTISIQSIDEVPLLQLVQEKIYTNNGVVVGQEDKIASLLLIVIRDKKLLGTISKLKLTIPHKIALLDGGMLEKPTVTYYGSHI